MVQFSPSAAPDPVQAPAAHPAQFRHLPLLHWVSAVHQQGVADPPHALAAPDEAVAVSHVPL